MIGEVPVKRVCLGVLKIKCGMTCEGFVALREVLGFNVHWLLGRSYMCPGEDCAACFAGVPSRWNGFLVVRARVGHATEMRLLELSSAAYERFAGLVRMEGWPDLAGVHFTAVRSRAKASLYVEPLDRDEDRAAKALSPLRCWEAVACLYGLPVPRPDESLEEWEVRARSAAGRLVAFASEKASR